MTKLDTYLAQVKAREEAATPGPAFTAEELLKIAPAAYEYVAAFSAYANAKVIPLTEATTDVQVLREMVASLRSATQAALDNYVEFYGPQENGPLYNQLVGALIDVERLAAAAMETKEGK